MFHLLSKSSCAIIFLLICLLINMSPVCSIKCYQCSSDQEDPDGKDLCGAFTAFDETKHTPVDCLQEQAYTPGIFCMKEVRQGPRTFIWDKRWRTVIRRCTSVSETGATNVCNWGVDENNVFWEQCYCTSDSCNKGTGLVVSSMLVTVLVILVVFVHLSDSLFR